MRHLASALLAILGLAAASCSSSDAGDQTSRGPKRFGQVCTASEECRSLSCLTVGSEFSVCTRACEKRSDCPEAPNWACGSSDGSAALVCTCTASSTKELCGDGIDNDCDSNVDDCLVCGGVTVPPDDPKHCGMCDNACRKDQTCQEGTCTCAEGRLECGGTCVDVATDESHCGACGKECPSAQACKESTCVCPNAALPTYCDAAGCVDTSSNPEHCGECGRVCPAEQACKDGVCACPSATSPDYCPATGCVDLYGDAANCGTCGKKCEAGQTCDEGACVCPFSGAPDYCDGTGCVNLDSDPSNCGSCGNACGAGQSCHAGACACPTGQPDFCASAGCVNLDSNPVHCGACGHACGPAQQCVAGQCACPGFAPTQCAGDCVDTQVEPGHCGACGHECGAAQHCDAGQCKCDATWLALCDGKCVDQLSDPSNCGTCGQDCGAGEKCLLGACTCSSGLTCNGVCVSETDPLNCGACGHLCAVGQVCNSGVCQCPGAGQASCGAACVNLMTDTGNCGLCAHACNPGETCNSGACACPGGGTWCLETGACTNLQASVDHCGSCGTACQNTQVCKLGVCTCPELQQKYCASQGMCINTATDPLHCGSCDHPCPATQSCVNGACQCPQAGQSYCGSVDACVATASDSQHCGGCDKACPPGTQCQASVCKCQAASQTLCGSTCVDLKTDAANCGACSAACTGNLVCSSGKCACPPPALGPYVRLTTTLDQHHGYTVAWNGTHIGLAYGIGDFNLYPMKFRFALLNPDGTRAMQQDLELASRGDGFPHVIWTGQEWGVVWRQGDYSTGVRSLWIARLTPDGQMVGSPVDIGAATPGGVTNSVARTQPHLAFMPSRGYAIVTSSYEATDFQLLGIDGAHPEPAQHHAVPSTGGLNEPPLIASSATEWGLLIVDSYGVYFGRLNADGSMTNPWVKVQPFYLGYNTQPYQVAHDGATWIVANKRMSCSAAPYRNETVLHRGEAMSAVTVVGALEYATKTECQNGAVLEGHFGISGDKLVVMNRELNARFSLRRFTLPADTNAPLVPAGEQALVLDTSNYMSIGGHFMPLLIGPDTALATWLDTRWGLDYQIMSRRADYQECQ